MKIGDKVSATAFTDCYGKHHDRIDGLTVTDVHTVEVWGITPYQCVMAGKDNPYTRLDGAEHFFIPTDGRGA